MSLDDIYSDFKTLDANNVEHSYITDILITSNDPRYELIIDSIFLFEFEENATLYDSDIFDIFENNHLEKFYVGDYTDIYSESIILDASEFLPLYQDDPAINETYYFDAFDSDGNWYYFDEHLSGQETTSRVYDITWNPQYNEEYYYAYRDQDSDLQDLFEYYNPHIDTFRYLYLSWADQNAWNEWHTIETPNVNISTIDITFEWYDEILEKYQTVVYDQSLNEFEARHIAIENIFPYNSGGDTDTFDLSQDYSDAQNLEIMMIKGLFFNESEVDFDPADSNLPDGKSIQIQAPNSISLRNFEKVIVYLNFTEGAYSDYTQFRLLQNAKDKSGPPSWTKNDSIYIDYEYNDIDYFLLMEDYAVGSDDSLFEYLEYVRNDNFVIYNTLTSKYEFNNDIQLTDFANFSRRDDKRTSLELYDFNLDGEHELVIQSQDVDIDGIYDVYKYGEVNSAGENVFHTTLIKTKTTNIETQKTSDVRSTKYYEIAGDDTIFGDKFYVENKNGIPYMVGTLFGRRTLITNTTTTSTTTKTTVIIQKDLDLDGLIDKDITFEASSTFSETTTYTTEIMGFFLDDIFSTKMFPEGAITELRDSFIETSAKSHLFTFRDYENGEVSSVRIYEDTFANELSAKYNPNTYLKVITNDNGDEDPSNDLTLQAPALEDLLSFTHTTDNVPALFDSKTTITDSLVFENILTVQKTVSIPDSLSRSDKVSSTLEVIQVIPDDGKVIIDSNPKTNPRKVDVGGEYWFYSSAQDGVFDTIFVVNREEKVLAIGFDYDYNSHFEPNKKIFSEKHLISSTSSGLWDFSNLGPQNRVFLRDYNSYDGYFLDDVFSDSLYDVWKIMYNTETSTLMKEVSAITSSQFVQSVQGKIVQDILWQVGAALISTLFGIVTHTGTAGFILMYAILSGLNAMKQAHDNAQLLASQTLYNEDYDGAITLSSKNEADKVWGGSIPDMIIGSSAGVYSDVFLEYDNHNFEGALILAPQGWKKTNWGSNFPISLDYAIQTRDYSGYSDTDDPRLSPHSVTSTQSPNAIMGLENAINKETDGEYNKLYPYLQRNDGVFVPTFQFAGVDTEFPMPEFYHEYPIFVDSSSYSTVKNDQFTIYKIFDTESSQDIELIPEDKIHMIYADIQQINVYQYEYLGKDSNGNDIHNSRFVGSYLNNTFSFNKATGVLTLDDGVYSYLISNAQAKASAYIGDPDYEVFYVFEVKVAKYQALDPTNLDENRVATMQAIEQNILEYTYQYRHAQITQETLSQMSYTVFVTTISTILTVGATYAIGKLAKYLTKGASTAMIPTFTESLLGEVSKFATRPTIGTMIVGMAAKTTLVKFVLSPIFESIQEIFMDPLLEIVVSELVASLGLDIFMQVFINSLVEGGRESITGPMSQFLFGNAQANTQKLVSEHHITNEISAEKAALDKISERKSHIKIKPQWSSILKTGATLVLGAALVGIGGPMFFSGTLVAGFSAIKTFSKSFKIHKTIIHNIVSEQLPSDYDLNDVIADSTDALIDEGIEDAIEWAQVSSVSKDAFPITPEHITSIYEEIALGLGQGGGAPSYNIQNELPAYYRKIGQVRQAHQGEVIYEKMIEYSEAVVQSVRDEFRAAKVEIDQKDIQTKIIKFVAVSTNHKVMFGDPIFDKVVANPAKYGYLYNVYRWNWKGQSSKLTYDVSTRSLNEVPYIGYSVDFQGRIQDEVMAETLKKIANDRELTVHQSAIAMALRMEREEIIREINSIDIYADIDPMTGDLGDVYHWYKKHGGVSKAKKLVSYILSNKVIHKYFDIKIIEVHDSQASALASEKDLTINMPHIVEGNLVEGTIWPKGLNMIEGGGGVKTGAKQIVINNILDVIALASLGLHETTIAEILTRVYHINIIKGTISEVLKLTEFKSFDGLQEAVLKPVVWEMIKDDAFFTIDQLKELFPFDYRYLDTRLNKWFGDSLLTLRRLIMAGAQDWQTIQTFSRERIEIFRGQSPVEIKQILLNSKSPNADLTNVIGLGSKISTVTMHKISQYYSNQDMVAKDLQKYLRKEEAQRLLEAGMDPHTIIDEIFDLSIWRTKDSGRVKYVDKGKVRYYFEDLFSGLTFEQIVTQFHNNPTNILNLYRSGNVIIQS